MSRANGLSKRKIPASVRIEDRTSDSGRYKREAAAENLAAPHAVAQPHGVSAEYVAPKSCHQHAVAHQFAQIIIFDLGQCLTLRRPQDVRIKIICQNCRADRTLANRRQIGSHVSDVERLPCLRQVFMSEIARRQSASLFRQEMRKRGTAIEGGNAGRTQTPQCGFGGGEPDDAVTVRTLRESRDQSLKRQISGPPRHRVIAETHQAVGRQMAVDEIAQVLTRLGIDPTVGTVRDNVLEARQLELRCGGEIRGVKRQIADADALGEVCGISDVILHEVDGVKSAVWMGGSQDHRG